MPYKLQMDSLKSKFQYLPENDQQRLVYPMDSVKYSCSFPYFVRALSQRHSKQNFGRGWLGPTVIWEHFVEFSGRTPISELETTTRPY